MKRRSKKHLFLWLRNRTTENRKGKKAQNIKGKWQSKNFSTVSRQLVARLSSARDNLLFKPYQNGSKSPENQGFMFIGTQCDLWGRPDGTGHEKISRGNFPRLIFSLIPSLFERHISIGCADLIWDITLDEISALCLFIGRGPFFA